MFVNANITVYRNDEPFEVEVSGRVERISSYNPKECGLRITSLEITDPEGFHLELDECDKAIEALEAQI